MRQLVFTIVAFSLLLLASCSNNKPQTNDAKQTIVLRFELDSTGNIADEEVKKQLTELALRISANADKVLLHSYTEKMETKEAGIEAATHRAEAVKVWMYKSAERIYYNVGIDAKDFENPLDAVNPCSGINRRIEIEYLQ